MNDLIKREQIDPDWRNRELRELAIPIEMERSVEIEELTASHKMLLQEIIDSLPPDQQEAFIKGWNKCLDYMGELNISDRKFDNILHNIYDEWLKKNDPATLKESVT